ncbi:type II toxin-antitoxin system VapC family toxin [Propionicimonas sp.]|uniref:type II toxin-antitoxin system VapC family toxin n=1 Tax=Propionicimonas sp. TaxID=1955623 RepID=UPI0039E2CA79
MIVRPHSILLDAEALSALAQDERSMQAWATFAKRSDSVIYASCVTLAEVTDGTARDVAVRRAVKAVRLIDVHPDIGYRAGQLRAIAIASRRKQRDLTVDSVVAATALTLPLPVVVLTSDPEDLRFLLAGSDVQTEII